MLGVDFEGHGPLMRAKKLRHLSEYPTSDEKSERTIGEIGLMQKIGLVNIAMLHEVRHKFLGTLQMR